MNKLLGALRHLTNILSMMFLVFLVLDRYNPMMNFVNNNISCVLLAILCVSCMAGNIITLIKGEKIHEA
ncbi:MAG: hypothetical protein Q4C54_09620 [Clostridia bacterium]|nr:hypothetical protein [Clostridia bacterium]